MKIKDITSRHVAEDAKVTNIDPTKKTVTYSDPSTNITTTVPDTMVKPTDGGVQVDTKAVGAAGTGEGPKIAVGADVKDMSTTEGSNVPYFVDTSSGTPMAKTSPKPTIIVPSDKWSAVTPEIEAKASAQGFHKVTLQANGKTFVGLEGGDQKYGSKILVPAADYQALKGGVQEEEGDIGGDPTDKFIDQVRDKNWERYPRSHNTNSPLTKSPLSENDELYKWLTIAGLK